MSLFSPCTRKVLQFTPELYFNPRTRMGCDTYNLAFFLIFYISIHAPAWGATPNVIQTIADYLFQSTHPYGVRR